MGPNANQDSVSPCTDTCSLPRERGFLRGEGQGQGLHGLVPALASPSWPNPSQAGLEATLPTAPMGRGASWHQPTSSGLSAQHGQRFQGTYSGERQWLAERASLKPAGARGACTGIDKLQLGAVRMWTLKPLCRMGVACSTLTPGTLSRGPHPYNRPQPHQRDPIREVSSYP